MIKTDTNFNFHVVDGTGDQLTIDKYKDGCLTISTSKENDITYRVCHLLIEEVIALRDWLNKEYPK